MSKDEERAREQRAADFYWIDEANNDAICGELNYDEIERTTVFAWMAAFAASEVAAATKELQVAHDHVDADNEQMIFELSSRAEAAESRVTALQQQVGALKEALKGLLSYYIDHKAYCTMQTACDPCSCGRNQALDVVDAALAPESKPGEEQGK